MKDTPTQKGEGMKNKKIKVIVEKRKYFMETYGMSYSEADYLAAHLIVGQSPDRILQKLKERHQITTRQIKSLEKGIKRQEKLIDFIENGGLDDHTTL